MTNDPKVVTERGIAVVALVIAVAAPAIFNAYWIDVILTQALIVGIAASSSVTTPIFNSIEAASITCVDV